MAWSIWKNTHNPSGHSQAAVYKIRLVELGCKVPITRLYGIDQNGILCIGKTTNMERRRKDFINSVERGVKGHSEGRLIFWLIKFSRLRLKHPIPQYQYTFNESSVKQIDKLERKLIKAYITTYGELPPLNCTIPGRKLLFGLT